MGWGCGGEESGEFFFDGEGVCGGWNGNRGRGGCGCGCEAAAEDTA